MGRVFGILMMLAALWVGMEIYTKGIDQAVYGAFAPLDQEEHGSRASGLADTIRMDDPIRSDPAVTRRTRAPITTRVRERVNAHMARGAARYEDR